jgi:hypothetical protein
MSLFRGDARYVTNFSVECGFGLWNRMHTPRRVSPAFAGPCNSGLPLPSQFSSEQRLTSWEAGRPGVRPFSKRTVKLSPFYPLGETRRLLRAKDCRSTPLVGSRASTSAVGREVRGPANTIDWCAADRTRSDLAKRGRSRRKQRTPKGW